MPYDHLDKNLLSKVRPINIQFYLRSKGWKRTAKFEGKMSVYVSPSVPNQEIIVPLDTYFLDYAQRIADAISLLANTEKRDPKDILSDLLLQSPSDIVEFRITGDETKDGTIPIDEGMELFNGAWRILASSASAVVKPLEYYPRLPAPEAEVFLTSCRIGQTERGSFAARFICPVALPFQKLIDGEVQSTFTRQVTTTMARSIAAITKSIEEDSMDSLLQENKTAPIVSANLCEAIVDMQPQSDESSLNIDVTWAGEVTRELHTLSVHRLPKEYFPRIEELANALMPQKEESERPFIGKIFELKKGVPRLEMPTEGEVYILYQDEDLLRKAKMVLYGDDHRKACDAYRDGQFVKVEGKLLRRTRISSISDPKDFTIL